MNVNEWIVNVYIYKKKGERRGTRTKTDVHYSFLFRFTGSIILMIACKINIQYTREDK